MLKQLESRIKSSTFENAKLYQKVMTAIDTDTILTNGQVRYDTAFIVPISEQADQAGDQTQVHSQQITYTFGIIIAVRALNDRYGNGVHERLDTLKNETRKRIIGWTPDADEYNHISFIRGEVLDFTNGGLLWLEEYTTDYLYRGIQ